MKFKSNLLSNIFGKADKAEEQSAEQNPMEVADHNVAEIEAQNAQLTEANANLTALLAIEQTRANEQAASVADLTNQLSTVTVERDALAAEKQSLTEQLAKKPTGQLTTVVADPDKEEAIAGDSTPKVKSFRTPHDAQVDEYIKASTPNLK